jgi:hypothetical protein
VIHDSVALLASERFPKNIFVLRFEICRETQHLKAVAIAHGSEVELVAHLDEARRARGPVGVSSAARSAPGEHVKYPGSKALRNADGFQYAIAMGW